MHLNQKSILQKMECKSKYGKPAISIKPNIKQIYKTTKQYHSSHYVKMERHGNLQTCKVKPVFPLLPIFFQLSLLSNKVNTGVTKQNKSS